MITFHQHLYQFQHFLKTDFKCFLPAQLERLEPHIQNPNSLQSPEPEKKAKQTQKTFAKTSVQYLNLLQKPGQILRSSNTLKVLCPAKKNIAFILVTYLVMIALLHIPIIHL